MMNKTKLTALLLATTMTVSLVSCGNPANSTEPVNQETENETVSETSTYEVIEDMEVPLTQEEQNRKDLLTFYSYWRPRYVKKQEYVTNEDQYYVWYTINKYEGGNDSVPMTVSEAHGYGMLTMVMMHEYDEEAQEIFDGMVRYYNAHRSDIGPHLMSWIQCDNGTAFIDGADDGRMEEGPRDSATDGDMDIAYALLCADKVWGSEGEFDYKTLAVDMINDIMTYEISQETFLPTLGDWCYGLDESSEHYNATRSSDFIMSHFPAFYEATGDERWNKVYENTYALINQGVDDYQTGLLPDFWVWNAETKEYSPAYPFLLEDVSDGYYGYNSCRIPWRIGTDYLLNGNETAKKFAEAINAFISEASGGHGGNIVAGYKLDGTKAVFYDELCFVSPFLITAKCCNDEKWEEALRKRIISRSRDCYFGDCIKMIVLMVYNDIYMVP